MIPISDNPPGPRVFPIVMLLILVANIVVFIIQITLSPEAFRDFVRVHGVIPFEITTGDDLPPQTPYPVYLNLVTSMFLHGGLLHIASNMLYLWIFGDNVEAMMGHGRFLIFYLVCGIGAAFGQIVVDPTSTIPAIGASGAIAGILGAYLVYFPSAQIKTVLFVFLFFTITRLSAIVLIGLWIIIQVVSGIGALGDTAEGGVAYWAHVGGFFIGLLLAKPLQRRSITSATRG
jgi:membrane associated rhomboid family serine protease